MQFSVSHSDPVQQTSDCLVVGVFTNKKLSNAARMLDQASNGQFTNLLSLNDLNGDVGQTLVVYSISGIEAKRVLLVGCGEEKELSTDSYIKLVTKAAMALKAMEIKKVYSYLPDLNVKDGDIAWKIRQNVQLTADGFYVFDQFKSKKATNKLAVEEIVFNVAESSEIAVAEGALKEANAIVTGMNLTRNLGNLPANICTPTYIAEQALHLAKEEKALKVNVLDQAEMQKLGMETLLGVAKGSHQPPKFIIVEYRGGSMDDQPVVLVGKGVTFDSGGISLKGAAGMEEMKYDMCGAASVLGTMKAIASIALPLNVVGIIPAVENMPGGGALKPGDVVTSLSGITVEIVNTDAEGRLILCDALSYSERFNPAVVIDIATLTGSIVATLGNVASGLMGNDPALIAEIQQAATKTHDRVWELPLWEDYQEQINSNIADIMNSGSGFTVKSAIAAACFLARFTKKMHWAHIDIAGTAWNSGKDKMATGRPVPLLTQFLIDRSKLH